MNKKVGIAIISVVVLALLLIIINPFRRYGEVHRALKSGKKQLETLEKQNIAAIESEIEELESLERKEKREDAEVSMHHMFRNAVVVGDSITKGLEEYQVIKKENVIAKIGVNLDGSHEMMEQVIGLNKKKIFLAFGMNDLEETGGNEKLFCKHYKKVIDKLQKALPESDIYVNSILPMQEKAIQKTKENGKYPVFNQALQKLCEDEKVTFIDNTDLAKKEFFEPDGIHMKLPYYKEWTKKMAEIGDL